MRIVTKAGLAGLALTTATGLMVATSGATNAAPATKSSAYGLAIYADGKEEFPPTPYVESTDGSTQTQGGEIPENPVVYGGVAALSAGNDEASVRVADLTVGEALAELPPELTGPVGELEAACAGLEETPGEQIPPILSELPIGGVEQPTEEEIVSFCEGLLDEVIPNLAEIKTLDVRCDGDSGSVTVAGVEVLGAEVPFAGEVPEDTTLLPAESPVNITLNRQTAGSDGSYTVDGIVATLGPEGEGEIVIGSATCGEPIAAPPGDGGGDPAPPAAPAPTPVAANAPVTG